MDNIANISLVGAGNMAHQLAKSFSAVGLTILEVFARRKAEALKVAENLPHEVSILDSLDFTKSQADLIVLCVSDEFIGQVAGKLKVQASTTVVHTSGSTDLSSLYGIDTAQSIGVLYPLQSVSKGRSLDLSDVPIFIEAIDFTTRSRLLQLAIKISRVVRYADSDQRRRIHLAAVLASNFTNYLLSQSFGQLEREGFDNTILKQLVLETINKAFENGPLESQTGPARRGDDVTMQRHLELLSDHPKMQELYTLISALIADQFKK